MVDFPCVWIRNKWAFAKGSHQTGAIFIMKNILWSIFTHSWNLEKDTKNVLMTFVSARIVKTSLKRLSLEASILAWKFACVDKINMELAFAWLQGQVVWIRLSNSHHPGTQLPSLTRGQPWTEPCGHVILVSQCLWRDTLYKRKLRSREVSGSVSGGVVNWTLLTALHSCVPIFQS